ncbi:MAG: DUF4160 domain-containing protein [Ignavibacteria bacterium]|jgi:hypothetical protein|nr:DUF4160 domain-containing protein [Ignavibacteria bacterium]MCU7526537.1 DUF4160 domain-containing protein [Ignavibacteria bacterium]
MPTVLRVDGFRFYFYSHETTEPPHIHVDKDGNSAKFWLNPVSLARNIGYSAKELRVIQDIIQDNQSFMLEKWNGYFI